MIEHVQGDEVLVGPGSTLRDKLNEIIDEVNRLRKDVYDRRV